LAETATATGYEPLDTLKPVADDIWLIDGPPQRFHAMPYPTRCTLVRLQNGDLWVHSPTALTSALRKEVDALGPVRHLIAPNWIQGAHIADWQRAYPEALAYSAPGTGQRSAKKGLKIDFDHDLDETAQAPWSGQIDQIIVHGSRVHREAVFFHRASQSLIVADLIENLETAKLPVWMRPLVWLAGSDDSDGKMRLDMRMTFRKAPLADAVERMIAWQPRRLILAHGRWYPENAVDELRRAFRRVLNDREWTTVMDQMKTDRTKKDG